MLEQVFGQEFVIC